MENDDWQEFVEHLVEAKRELARAWNILDGTDGAAERTEEAVTAATDAIDCIFRSELGDDFNADVAAPVKVQEFWERHGQLPGFAIGT